MEKNAKIFNEGPKLNAFFSGNIKWKYADRILVYVNILVGGSVQKS